MASQHEKQILVSYNGDLQMNGAVVADDGGILQGPSTHSYTLEQIGGIFYLTDETFGSGNPVYYPDTPGSPFPQGTPVYASRDGIRADFSSNQADVSLRGGVRADLLIGGYGNDVLEGGGSGDRLVGGRGSDTASYQHAAGSVQASLADASGNAGEAAGDTYSRIENLRGGRFDDVLRGDGGGNMLSGGAGADTMVGAAGDDVYVVDNARDKVTEGADAGSDTVHSSVSFTLAANVERLVLTGGGAIDGTGNDRDNVITGNGRANTLNGLGGNDTLNGLDGDDTLSGQDGDDTLSGGWGKDTLTGGEGKDAFVFNQRFLKSFSFDVVTDFMSAEDTMRLSASRFLDLKTDKQDTLLAACFKDISADGAKVDGSDRILYDKARGDLYYDRDGSLGQYGRIKFVEVKDGTSIDHTDFLVV